MKTISLISITLNNAGGLEKTLRSVAAQSYGQIQHIVVDGYSTDGTDGLLAQYPQATVVRQKPSGVYSAINAGIHQAHGDIIGLLHSGDVFSADDVLARVAATFDDDPTLDFVIGDVHFPDRRGGVLRYYSGAEFRASDMRYGIMPPHPSLYITAQAARRVGDYREDIALSADFEMFVRLTRGAFHWKYIPLDMVCMSTGGLSFKWKHRLYTHNMERIRALRLNGIPCNPLLFIYNYYRVFKSYVCKNPNKPKC